MLATRQFPKPMIPGNALNSMPSYLQLSPSGGSYPQLPSSSISSELDKYLLELLSERQEFRSFMQAFPICSRLLNQEIVRITGLVGSTSYGEHDLSEHGGSLASTGSMLNRPGDDLNDWSAFQSERLAQHATSTVWQGLTGGCGVPGSSPAVKKVLRLEVPVDKYPNYNFVGRLLGPRGNSLKRVESTTGCRVFIRGRGSVKDSDKEEKLRDKAGYEHLNEPLHVLIEAEQPADVIDIQLNRAREIIEDLLKPVDESHDYFKKQQLRELAMLNGTLREETPYWSGSVSLFSNPGMKRAKTRR